ncbi:Ig-like domain-containing protein [Deinococcus koreensis]|uniref:Ig-like domain-containing protein n=1 Tax=Deinococcus koreensis TaxID=2054903 RepID=UPI0013FDB56C|nr:Ig-like domain-containing protein [Deinococcus koreensis]
MQIPPPPRMVCTDIGRPALDITVKNERGQVLARSSDMEAWNAPWLKIDPHRDGSYGLTVKRRWYEPQTVKNIVVQYDGCGPVRATPVVVRLRPVRGAPLIRDFRFVGVHSDNTMVVGSWPYFQRYHLFLDAPGSVSREVVWTSGDPSVATVDQTGMVRSVCSRQVGRTTITATLRADPRFTVSTVFGRGGRGMVCPRGPVDR